MRDGFEWGAADCATAAAEHVREVTGVCVWGRFRGLYASEAEALALARDRGGLLALIDEALAPVRWVRGGHELAAFGDGEMPALATAAGARFWRLVGRDGRPLLVRRGLVSPRATWGP